MDTQVTLSLFDVIIMVVAFVIGWFLGQYWKAHQLGAMTNAQRWQELTTNSRAADVYQQAISPEMRTMVQAMINEAVAKIAGPK